MHKQYISFLERQYQREHSSKWWNINRPIREQSLIELILSKLIRVKHDRQSGPKSPRRRSSIFLLLFIAEKSLTTVVFRRSLLLRVSANIRQTQQRYSLSNIQRLKCWDVSWCLFFIFYISRYKYVSCYLRSIRDKKKINNIFTKCV